MFTPHQIQEIKKLCLKYKVKNFYVFGSILTSDFNKNSDIDFLVDFPDTLSVEDYTTNYLELHAVLESFFNRKIDLITSNSLKNPYFIQSIDHNKELLYSAA
jgi:predicted nucleotidyltransferase